MTMMMMMMKKLLCHNLVQRLLFQCRYKSLVERMRRIQSSPDPLATEEKQTANNDDKRWQTSSEGGIGKGRRKEEPS